MTSNMLRILTYILIIFLASEVTIAQNTSADEYAPAFRQTENGLELWLTSNSKLQNKRDRQIARYVVDNGDFGTMRSLPAPLNQASNATSGGIIQMDGAPAFPAGSCEGKYGIFVSNRNYNGQNFGNDIYEMNYYRGIWNSSRINSVCSEFWDDTPSLSPDGTIMVFSSDINI